MLPMILRRRSGRVPQGGATNLVKPMCPAGQVQTGTSSSGTSVRSAKPSSRSVRAIQELV